MGSLSGTCEIMESHEECDFVRRSKGINPPQMDGKAGKLPMLKAGRSYALEDDINQLFEAINFRPSGKGFSQSLQLDRGTTSKKASKNPHRVGLPQASGIGISESVSLKQALRRLTISHASEMAAMKRLSNPTSSPGVSEAGAIKKLYRAVVAEANESGLPLDEGKGSLIEISIVPEEATMSSSKKMPESLQFFRTKSPLPSARSSPRPATTPKGSGTKKPAHSEILFESSKVGGKVSPKIGKKPLQSARSKSPTTSAHFSPRLALVATTKGTDRKGSPREEILPELNEVGGEKLTPKLGEKGKLKASPSLCNSNTIKEVLEEDEKDPTPKLGNRTSALELGSRSKPCTATSSCSSTGSKLSKSPSKRIRGGKLVFKPKTVIKKKAKPEPVSGSSSFGIGNEAKNEGLVPSSKSIKNKVMKDSVNEAKTDNSAPTTSKLGFQTHNLNKNARKESSSPASSSTSQSFEVCSSSVWQGVSEPELSSNIQKGRNCGPKVSKISRSKEKGQFSQSSKSSIGEYSTSTSISEESNLSGSSSNGNRPHMSKDLRWEAIHQVEARYGSLGLRHFKLLKRLGCGDIGTVYLAELSGTNCSFALKVMDNEFLACRKKMPRAQTEREILQMLDHPFLPTLYAYFTTDKFSCLVMEFCPGGDLHVLRQRQPTRCFSEHAAR